MRRNTLTGTKDVLCDGGIALNGDIAIATALQYRRHILSVKAILTYRGYLAATIDAMCHMSILVDGDCRVATYQSRIAMRLYASTATEDATINRGLTCSFFWCKSYLHLSVSLYSAYLATAIDITIHRAVLDVDNRSVSNTFLTPEGVVLTLAGSEHMAINDSRTTIDDHIANARILVIAIGSSIVSAVSIFPCKRSVVRRNIIYAHTA